MVNSAESIISSPQSSQVAGADHKADGFDGYRLQPSAAPLTRPESTFTAANDSSRSAAGPAGGGSDGALIAALKTMQQVGAILDGDVPRLNKTHDLAGVQHAFEQAIAMARAIDAKTLSTAAQELKQVRRQKGGESDPAKLKELTKKEIDLYTLTHIKDETLGNMALWYYRQGKVQQGNEKLIEALGMDPNSAQALSKLAPADVQALSAFAAGAKPAPSILADVNFFRHLSSIGAASEQSSQIFAQLHSALVSGTTSPAERIPAQPPSARPPAVTSAAPSDKQAPSKKGPQETATTGGEVGAARPAPADSEKTQKVPSVGENPQLSTLSDQELISRLNSAKQMQAAGFDATRALFAEAFRRLENPAEIQAMNNALKGNLDSLESGKDREGKALDVQARMDLHEQNVLLISKLSLPAQLHNDYADYLGDGRLTSKDIPVSQMQAGLNQIKSMDEQQRLAIKAADSVDLSLIKRADAAINSDRRAAIGDQEKLTQYRQLLEGLDGSGQIGLLNARVALRDQLAALYLSQGVQLNKDGSPNKGGIVLDSLFRPKDALQLLNEARDANQQINGATAHDAVTDSLLAFGSSIHPEIFQSNSQYQKNQGASGLSDGVAMAGSLAGTTLLKFGLMAAAELLTEGRANPAMINTISNIGGIGTGIVSHRLAYKAMTGQWESWSDSTINGGISAAAPIIARTTMSAISENPALSSRLNWRLAPLSGQSILARTAGEMGAETTFADAAKIFRSSGLSKQAEILDGLGTRTISSATAEEMRALNTSLKLDGAAGREALLKILPRLKPQPEAVPGVGPLRSLVNRAGSGVVNAPGAVARAARGAVWDNRFYRIAPVSTAPLTEEAGAVSAETRAGSASLLDHLPNIKPVDPLTVSEGQLKVAGRGGRYIQSVAAALPATLFFNSASSLYNNYAKGRTYIGADNKPHVYSLTDALVRSNFGDPSTTGMERFATSSMGEALLGGMALTHEIPSSLDGGPATVASLARTAFGQVKRGPLAYGFTLAGDTVASGWLNYRAGSSSTDLANIIATTNNQPLVDFTPENSADQ
jgi:hypothetical protein